MTNRVYGMTSMAVLALAALAPAQTFTTLYNFTGGSDGGQPYAGIVQDQAGNLYGTTAGGGDLNCGFEGLGCGVVYKLDTAGTETVQHSFSGSYSGSPDGELPWTPVARDEAGNIFGTTYEGGTTGCVYADGCGTVFKIDTAGKETVLYSFTGGLDGCYPEQGLVLDVSGTVFGTTSRCGAFDLGTIFEVDRAGNFAVLHSFAGYPSDGGLAINGHLAMDKSGNIYGLTSLGGSVDCQHDHSGCGALYKLTKKGKLTVLHSFGRTKDGCTPYGSVVQDSVGNFYGTTESCGSKNDGTVWEVSKKGRETTLHNFAGGHSDGCHPFAGVTQDLKGNLYGVTAGCGANKDGALYELSPLGKITLLHSFDSNDGAYPDGEVLRTASGTLIGATYQAGVGTCAGHGCGTVWSYVP